MTSRSNKKGERSFQNIVRAMSLLGGIAMLVGGVYIVRDQLADIMVAEPDIFYAPLIGGAVFLITKAFQPTKAQLLTEEAADLIRDRSSPRVNAIVDDEVQRRFEEHHIGDYISTLTRNIDASIDRLNEYYSVRSSDQNFHVTMPLISVVADDLDKSFGNLKDLRDALSSVSGNAVKPSNRRLFTDEQRVRLESILRDVREAINRRNEFFQFVVEQPSASGLLNYHLESFRVVSSDLFKSYRIVVELLGVSRRNRSVEQEISGASDYVFAALTRALNLAESMGSLDLGSTNLEDRQEVMVVANKAATAIERASEGNMNAVPASYGVMLRDCASALRKMEAYLAR